MSDVRSLDRERVARELVAVREGRYVPKDDTLGKILAGAPETSAPDVKTLDTLQAKGALLGFEVLCACAGTTQVWRLKRWDTTVVMHEAVDVEAFLMAEADRP